MQVSPISPRATDIATDIGQLFAGGGGRVAVAAGSQAVKGTEKGESAVGSFLAALTLEEGEGKSEDWTAQGNDAGFDLSAEQGAEEQRDPPEQGPVAVSTAERSVVPQVAPVDDVVAAGWSWAAVEPGASELPVAVVEPDGNVPERDVPVARSTDEVSPRSAVVKGPVPVVSGASARKAPDRLVVPVERFVQDANTAVVRGFAPTAADAIQAAPSVDAPAVGSEATDRLVSPVVRRTASEIPVPRPPLAEAPTLAADAPEVVTKHVAAQGPRAEQLVAVARDDRSRADFDADVERQPAGEGKAEGKASVNLATEADGPARDARHSEATIRSLPAQSSPMRRERSPERDTEVIRVVHREPLPQRPIGAVPGEQPEARPLTPSSRRESGPKQSQRADTVPVEKGPSRLAKPRSLPAEERVRTQVKIRESAEQLRTGGNDRDPARWPWRPTSTSAMQENATEAPLRGLSVENLAVEGVEWSDWPARNPQDGKAVENSFGEPVVEATNSPEQRSAPLVDAQSEVPMRSVEPSVFLEETPSDRMPSTAAVDGVKLAPRRAAGVLEQRPEAQSANREVRPREPETRQVELGLTAPRKDSASARGEAVEIEAYRLTLEGNRKAATAATESLKPFRNKGLGDFAAMQASNPKPVDKKSRSHGPARIDSAVSGHETAERRGDFGRFAQRVVERTPLPVAETSRPPRAYHARPLLGAEQDGFTEVETDREGPAEKRPSAPSTERPERQPLGLRRSESHSEIDATSKRSGKQVGLVPFVSPGKTGPKPQARRATAEVTKPHSEVLDTVRLKTVEGPRPPVATTPSPGTLTDKAPDAPGEKPVAGTEAPRKALVETALLDRRADQNALQVQVKDDQLGRVVVRLTERAGLIRAMVRTDGTQSRDLLNQQLPALMESLLRRGFETRQDGLAEESPGGRGNTDSRDEQRRQRHPQRQRREGRNPKPEFRIRLS